MCHFVIVVFSPFSIAITSLGEERANLSAFRTFVRFVLVWICRFPLPPGVWEGLRFVIVALPGLFSYLFCDRSKVVVPVLVLLFVALWFILRGDLFYVLCYFVLVFFSPFSIAITSLGEERELILVLFVRLFDLRLFGFVCFLFLCVWDGLQFVIVALPGLFSYPFLCDCGTPWTFLLLFFLSSLVYFSCDLFVARNDSWMS